MKKVITPEQEFEDPNDFYTVEEAERYNQNSAMRKMQIELTEIALQIAGVFHLEHKKIIDVGCGTGFSMEYLQNNGSSEVIGIDPSKEMVKIAEGKKLCVCV